MCNYHNKRNSFIRNYILRDISGGLITDRITSRTRCLQAAIPFQCAGVYAAQSAMTVLERSTARSPRSGENAVLQNVG